MDKNRKIILGISSAVISSLLIMSSITIQKFLLNKKDSKRKINQKIICVEIYGAVLYPGEYELLEGSLLIDLLKKCKLEYGADLSKISVNSLLKNKQRIYISFSKNIKQKITNFTTLNSFLALGIRKNIALKIINHLKENKYKTTWQNIQNISGVRETTLKILQDAIIL
ncbi:MAG0490 family ComEA-like DNA-binding protein [Metamycoplasma equirhinis]|uniref:MAG0490 family ComEA-like DNA-binding protein n=1 Tax=Metamycoplasma equirhinis TaxID=92402 RepID=UPI0035942368